MRKASKYPWLPFTQFTAGYRTYKIKVFDTAKEYVEFLREHTTDVDQKTVHENGCTMKAHNLICINLEAHSEDEADLLHTVYHEMLHCVWFAMGRFRDADHNEVEIDNIASVLTQIHLTKKSPR